MALDQKRQGRTVLAYLQQIEREFGYFRNELRTLVLPGVEGRARLAHVLGRLRAAPLPAIGPLAVTRFEDLQDEAGPLGPFKGATDRAARDFLVFHLGDSARISLRPSGTEPKAKAYIEVSCPPCPPGLPEAEWNRRCREVDRIATELADTFIPKCLSL